MRKPAADRRNVTAEEEPRPEDLAIGTSVSRPLGAREVAELRAAAARFGVSLDDPAIAQLERFRDELLVWSARTNLLSRGDLAHLLDRHVIDSLAAVPLLRRLGAHPAVADLGSGAGFPGVPLAIVLQPERTLLVEARRRRASFLRAVARALPSLGIEVENRRVESIVAGDHPPFDAVVSRASFDPQTLFAAAAPLLRLGGWLLAYRGPTPSSDEESCGPLLERREEMPYRLAGIPSELRVVVWERTGVPRETAR